MNISSIKIDRRKSSNERILDFLTKLKNPDVIIGKITKAVTPFNPLYERNIKNERNRNTKLE